MTAVRERVKYQLVFLAAFHSHQTGKCCREAGRSHKRCRLRRSRGHSANKQPRRDSRTSLLLIHLQNLRAEALVSPSQRRVTRRVFFLSSCNGSRKQILQDPLSRTKQTAAVSFIWTGWCFHITRRRKGAEAFFQRKKTTVLSGFSKDFVKYKLRFHYHWNCAKPKYCN